MKLHLFIIAFTVLCLHASAQDKPAASSGTDTASAPKPVLAPSAIDPGSVQQQPAVQPRLAAQAQDTPAKKEEDSNDPVPVTPKQEE